jgi:Heterokaryon incompatibility protein (HET)
MREDKRQGYIWADAICINQIDTSEKTEQVPLMADIYERAELVLVWLGKDEDNVRLGYNLMVEW